MTIALSDTFTDTNGTNLSAHTMDAGAGWTVQSGGWTIQSNKTSTTANGVATANAGAADGTLTLVASTPATTFYFAGGVVRLSDSSNYWIPRLERNGGNSSLAIYRVVAGSATQIASTDFGFGINGVAVTLTVALKGSTITLSNSATADICQVTNATFNQSATLVGISNDTTFGNPVVPLDNFQFVISSSGPTLPANATASDSTHIPFIFDAKGAACTVDATKFALGDQATYSGATLAVTIASGTTSTEAGTVTLSGGGLPKNVTASLVVADGAIGNINGTSSSTTITVDTSGIAVEDITSKVTFTATGLHSATVSFNDTGAIIGPFLPIADEILVPADLDNLNTGDPVDFSIQMNGVDAAVADTWTFTPAAGGAVGAGSRTAVLLALGVLN